MLQPVHVHIQNAESLGHEQVREFLWSARKIRNGAEEFVRWFPGTEPDRSPYSPGFAFCLDSRRAAASQEFAIQVPMPRRGSTHFINTMYPAITKMICSQSAIRELVFIIPDAIGASR